MKWHAMLSDLRKETAVPRFRDRSYKFANSVYRSSAQLWAESVSKEKNMMKKIFTAMLLASAISFAPVAAWAQNEPAESAPAETHHHHHHHHEHHHHHHHHHHGETQKM